MSISGSLSPHDDLVESTIQSAEYETIQEAFTVMFMKIDHLLAACLSAKSSLSTLTKGAYQRVIGFCGLFSSELIKITDKTIFVLSAPEGYSIKTVFLLFDTSWSGKGCPKHGMKWEDGDGEIKHYCGRRFPWLEYSNSHVVRLMIYGLQVYLDSFDFDFYIFYSICRICEAKKRRVTTVIVYNIINMKPVKAVTHTNSNWHIFAKPGNEVRLVVYYDIEHYLNVLEIYAGPGPNSTKILPSKSPIYSYDFFLLKNNISRYEKRFDTDTSHAYIVNTGRERNVSLVFRYGTIDAYQTKNCPQKFPDDIPKVTSAPLNISVTADGEKTVQCLFNYETNIHAALGERVYISLEIIDFVFQGPSIVSEYSDQPCHYGGVFFYSQHGHTLSPYSFCNAKGEYIPQIIALPSNKVFGVFQWFKGYSSGRLSAILHVTQCIINHMTPQNIFFSWPASSACQQFIFSWQNFLGTNSSSYSLNITSESDALLGPSTLSYSLANTARLLLTVGNTLQIIARHFTTWPKTDNLTELVFKHPNINYRSRPLFVSFLFDLFVTLHNLEIRSDWQITLKVSRSVCNGIMENKVLLQKILITEGCTMEHVAARNNTVTFIHAPLNHQLTYITLDREKECKGISVTKDEAIPSRDIHRHVYMRFTNIKQRVVFKHEISQSILTVTFNLTSLTPENCTRLIRVTPNDLSIEQQMNFEERVPHNIKKKRWIFHKKR